MPEAIAAAIFYIIEVAGASGLIGYTAVNVLAYAITIGAAVSYGSSQQRRAARRARDAYNSSLKDRELMIRSAVAPRVKIYGRDKVSGPIVYAQSTGSKREFLHVVVKLADHFCEDIETVYFNDVALPPGDAEGYIRSGEFSKQTVHNASVVINADANGEAALPIAATSVLSVYKYDEDGTPVAEPYSHTPGSNLVTGLTPLREGIGVEYTYTDSEPLVRVKKHLGGPGQVADTDLIAESGGKWTSDHYGEGICYVYVRIKFDQDIFGQVGLPNISAVVKGAHVYDPRIGASAWSDNTALCVADWIKDTSFGLGGDPSTVSDAELIAAANICDEFVFMSEAADLQRRYITNNSFDTQRSPRDQLEDLLSDMMGRAIWCQGQWLIRPGAFRTPGTAITEEFLAGPVSISPKRSRSDVFNAVRVTYRDIDKGWAEVQAPLVKNPTYEAEDGVQLVQDIRIESGCDSIRAQRLGKIVLERARQSVTVRAKCNLKAYDYVPSDVAPLTLSRYGYDGKAFEVMERVYDVQNRTIDYTWQETAAAVYSWNLGDATTVDPAPDTELPNPYARPAATEDLAVETGDDTLVMNGGSVVCMPRVSWSAVTSEFVVDGGHIEVQWRKSGDDHFQPSPPVPGDATQTRIGPAPDGQIIVVRARVVNAVGRASIWSSVSVLVVGKTAPPPGVSAFTVIEQPNHGRMYHWNIDTVPLDLDGFEARYIDASIEAEWESMVPLFEAGKLARTLDSNEPPDGEYTIAIKAKDTSGNESQNAYSIQVLLDASGFGDLIRLVRPHDFSWPGTKTGCLLDGYTLRSGSTETWDDYTTWDAFDSWRGTPISPIVYQHTDIDLGASLAVKIRAASVASSTATIEYQSSTNGVSYTSWGAVPSGAVTARYFRLRWTVGGSDPILYRAQVAFYS